MPITPVYRVQCSGPCRRWLSLPDDYEPGEDIPLAALVPKPTAERAGLWPDVTAARRAAHCAGWSSICCPDCTIARAVDHSIPPAVDRAIRRDHSLCGAEPCSDCR